MRHDPTDKRDDERFGSDLDEELLTELRASYNPPPEPPLDTMWERIEEDRRTAIAYQPAKRPWARLGWLIGMAAALIAGVAIAKILAA